MGKARCMDLRQKGGRGLYLEGAVCGCTAGERWEVLGKGRCKELLQKRGRGLVLEEGLDCDVIQLERVDQECAEVFCSESRECM